MSNIEDLLSQGRLESIEFNGRQLVVKEKAGASWHVFFEVTDRRLRERKKKSKLITIDRVVPQSMLPDVFREIVAAIEARSSNDGLEVQDGPDAQNPNHKEV